MTSVERNGLKPHSNFIAGHRNAALQFWCFGDFRCGVLLFMVILVIYKYKIGLNQILNVRLAGDHLENRCSPDCRW